VRIVADAVRIDIVVRPSFEHRDMTIWKQSPSIDQINASSRNTLVDTLGMRVTEVGDDFIRGTMPVDARTRQPFGLLHGGASVALAETLGSLAGNLCLDTAREVAVGLDINANHIRAVTQGLVTGTARALHIGRTTQVWEIRIEDEKQRLVCISRLTLAVVPKPT
jgi:1,4-dihydroxy-2-naphthoyl-CoA hydrolase